MVHESYPESKMLFRSSDYSAKFYLVGLKSWERDEIENLITENGGEISAARELPAVLFGNEKSVGTANEPLFHINFIRECVRQKKILHLYDFIIGTGPYFMCMRCVWMRDRGICPHCSTTSDVLSAFLNISVERKRPWNAEQVTEMLPMKSNPPATDSQFLTLKSPPDKDLLPQTVDSTVPESTPDGKLPFVPKSVDESTKESQKKNNKRKLEVIDLASEDDEPIEISIEEQKLPKVTEPMGGKLEKKDRAADLDVTADDIDEVVRASKEKKKPQPKAVDLYAVKKPQTEVAVLDVTSDDDDEVSRVSKEKAKRRKIAEAKAVVLDQQPSTSGMGKQKTTNGERSTTSSTKSRNTFSTDDSDTSSEEEKQEEAPVFTQAKTKKMTNGKKNDQRPKKTKKPKRNFQAWEQRIMIDYLILKDDIKNAKGLKIWKEMMGARKLPHRTS